MGHELLEQVNHLGHLAVDENPVPMDPVTIKTPTLNVVFTGV
jgi:hypothetical protein